MTCRSALHPPLAPAALAKLVRVLGSCWSETELKTQLEFGLSSRNLSPGLNTSFSPPHRGQLGSDAASFPLRRPAAGTCHRVPPGNAKR